jgi:hypothetical protein
MLMTVGGAVCIGDGYLGRVLTSPNKVKRLGKQAQDKTQEQTWKQTDTQD